MKPLVSFILGVIITGNGYAQTCQDTVVATAPDIRYLDNADGTVTDLYPGLVWKRCSEGQSGADCSTGTATTYTWQEALQHVETLNASGGFAGFTDWRLPNIKELASLVENQCFSPSINETLFPATQSVSYWSSSFYNAISTNSWFVSFNSGSGSVTGRNNPYYIRLVRGG